MRTLFTIFFATAILFFCNTNVHSNDTLELTVYFETDKDHLAEEEKVKLQEFIEEIKSRELLSLSIKGHTDQVHTPEYNKALSRRRAEFVQSILLPVIIADSLITKSYYGLSQPVADNQSEAGRSENRRVEISAIFRTSATIVDLFGQLKSDYQLFHIDPTRDTQIVGKAGSRFLIPADIFEREDGERPQTLITIHLKEALTPGEMLLNNLSTISNGRPLQTGGMIDWFATQDGAPLRFGARQTITILIPTDTIMPDMELFGSGDEGGNWTETGGAVHAVNNGQFWPNGSPLDFSSCVRASNDQSPQKLNFWERIRQFFGKDVKGDLSAQNNWREEECRTQISEAANRRLDAMLLENLDHEDIRTKQHYIFTTNRMRWINIDKLWAAFRNSERVNFTVDLKPQPNVAVRLVFVRNRSVFPLVTRGDVYADQLPAGAEVKIIAIKYEDNIPHFAIKETVISENIESLEFKTAVSPEELGLVLSTISF